MNIRIKPILLLSTLMWLSGCCPNGCFVLTGDAYHELAYPKPMRDLWIKEGVLEKNRTHDWVVCGGDKDGNFSEKEKTSGMERSNKKIGEIKAYSLLVYQVERCMLTKGYRYSGACYDNQISRESPACGAP